MESERYLDNLTNGDCPAITANSLLASSLFELPWCAFFRLSALTVGPYCLVIIAIDTERYATQLITFYATCLHDAVGPTFVGPSLAELAIHWVDCSSACAPLLGSDPVLNN